ncbi:transcriptional regulator [Thiohalobacter sp. COW1]|uniref:Transcriptional regulators n=1 Tax=Thiohalobacter thiocyanaticus TaxID=585455 RepID=A0A1Z4VQX3_9GAMM|nr:MULTISPECIES: MarR family transcriptional regulator [Thiohalobacter]BAZ94039.1 transcriptional regulators [Thiohalobacter thiocyanaticus]BCO30895.1 transcriptional regulator [Thiohalobacter sp. COW1]
MSMNLSALLLERLGALIHQSVREDAARHGLLPIHVQVLGYLAQANRYSDLPIAIAEYFGITRGTVSQSLAVLERKGLLVKRPDPKHGRRIHLELTRAGRAVLERSWAQRLDAALAAADAGGEALEIGLRSLLAELQRLNGQRAFGICRQCVHFQGSPENASCGLTGEPLAEEQTGRLCREWSQAGGQES